MFHSLLVPRQIPQLHTGGLNASSDLLLHIKLNNPETVMTLGNFDTFETKIKPDTLGWAKGGLGWVGDGVGQEVRQNRFTGLDSAVQSTYTLPSNTDTLTPDGPTRRTFALNMRVCVDVGKRVMIRVKQRLPGRHNKQGGQ
jgi:hypothetical protein